MDREINFGKFGKFNSNALIGHPFGLVYEIVDHGLKIVPPRPLQELGIILPSKAFSSV